MITSEWDFFVQFLWYGTLYGLMTYIFVWGITHFKNYINWK